MLENIEFLACFSLIVGSCFGSFANMLIYRLSSEKSLADSRSQCPQCQTPLYLRDLIPIFSYIFLSGKCRFCNHSIGIRYLIVELIMPIICFLFLYPDSFMYFNIQLLLFGFIACILFFTDLEAYMLPLPLTMLLLLIGIFISFLNDMLISQLIYTSIISGILLSIRWIANFIYKKDSFGLGDIILLAGISLNFGWQLCVSTFYCAVILGGFYSIILILLKKKSRKDLIPFGPFIILGSLGSTSFYNFIVPLLF